jgi:hypothetical protein
MSIYPAHSAACSHSLVRVRSRSGSGVACIIFPFITWIYGGLVEQTSGFNSGIGWINLTHLEFHMRNNYCIVISATSTTNVSLKTYQHPPKKKNVGSSIS